MLLNDIPNYQRVLLLQGPIGPFFRRLARFLEERGTDVFKINFNAGDALFYPALPRNPRVRSFRQKATAWKNFVSQLLTAERIQAIFLFGDCRFYHRTAIRIARRLGIAVFVFEEGYVRPDYVTLERDGVNGFSSFLQAWPVHQAHTTAVEPPAPRPVGRFIIWPTVFYAMFYGLAGALMRRANPYYGHQVHYFSVAHGLHWLYGWLLKPVYAFRERKLLSQLSGPLSKRYFLVPLQVHRDAQVVVHSEFRHVGHFIRHVIDSFAREAPGYLHLVLKHHPMDRGFRDHGRLIREAAGQLGVADRVHYVHDLHLPTLLRHARGTVVINSTVGLSSLLHGTPVKTHGKAVYNLPGLVHQGPLASFWRKPEPIDRQLHNHFRRYLIARTQINGNFYSWRGFEYGRELGHAAVTRTPTEPARATGRICDNPGRAGTALSLAAQYPVYSANGTKKSWAPQTPVRPLTASNSSPPRMTTRV